MNGTTRYTYDALNHLASTIDPVGSTSLTVYNVVGDLVSTTDALNKTTTYPVLFILPVDLPGGFSAGNQLVSRQ